MTRRSRPEARAALAAALALALCGPAAAREGDRQAPASIEADRVEIDRAAGSSRYFGNVVFVQGTLRLTGDRLLLRAPGGVVEHAEVHGERATIRQETDAGQIIRARGAQIVYQAGEGLVTLSGEAELLRDGERFAAGRIEYRPDTGRIDAGRGDDGGRVRIRIEPDEQNGSPDEASPEADGDGAQ